ncbi:unnamed protein product [Ophioblennius macclurei]
MASLRLAKRTLCSAAEGAAASGGKSRWERLKNSKAGVWCRSLFSDYKEACKDVVTGAWERPVKASVYTSLVGGAWLCLHFKPDHMSFDACLLEHSNKLGLLSPWIRSGTSDNHVQDLVKLGNEGRLRYLSLGLLSLVYRADYDETAALYEARCSNLSVPWRELPRRILDVGFAGRWWVLDSKMNNYDINEEEFKHLPVHMQLTSPPSVQEVEKNESLHKESLITLSVDDAEGESEGLSVRQ